MTIAENPAGNGLQTLTGWRAAALVTVMLAGTPLIALVFSTVAPVLPSLAAHFGASGGVMLAQWVMTFPAVGLMLGGPSGGYMIDRLGIRRLVTLSLSVFALAGSAGLYVDDPRLLLASRFFLGLSGSCFATASTWLIGARYEELARRKMIGAQNAISGAAAMSAVLISGWMAATAGWRAPFAIFLIALPLIVCALVSVPRGPAAARGAAEEPAARDVRHAMKSLWPLYLTVASMAGLMLMPATQVPFVLASNGVEDPVLCAQVIACSALMSIATAALFPLIRAKVGERGLMLLILGFYAMGTGALAGSHDAATTALACLFLGTATGLFTPHFTNMIIGRTTAALRGRAIGAMFGAIFLSEFVSPLIVLPLRQALGIHGGFVPLSAVLAAAFIAVALFRRRAVDRSAKVEPVGP